MIFTRYTEAAKKEVATIRGLSEVAIKSRWRRKFAFLPKLVTVPGEKAPLGTSYFIWFQMYYTRTIYKIVTARNRENIKYEEYGVFSVPNKEALVYNTINGSAPDSKNFERNISKTATATEKLIFTYDDSTIFRFGSVSSSYRTIYDQYKGTKLVKGLLTPDEYNEVIKVAK